MVAAVLAREALPDHGEFRAYHQDERDELLLEVLREEDGRAWHLRVPVQERQALARLVRQVLPDLERPIPPALDAAGLALLQHALIGPRDQVTAVIMAENEERAFALWRREELRAGWSWTIDLVLVPVDLAPRLCAMILAVLNQFDRTERNFRRA